MAYPFDGHIAMFEASGKLEFLDGALSIVNEVISTAKLSSTLPNSRYKDSYLSWPASGHPDPRINGDEYALFESYFWRYATKLLTVMKAHDTVYNNTTYRASFDTILAFIETNIFDKWTSRSMTNIYRTRTHMAAHWAMISMNLKELTSNQARKALASEIVNNIDNAIPGTTTSLKKQMIPHPLDSSAYYWDSVWGSFHGHGQDVAHGNNVIAYIVDAKAQGSTWTESDITALCRTLKEILWKVENGTNTFVEYLDGSGTGTGWFSEGFGKLGRFDAEIQERLWSHNVGRTTQLFGNAALNAKYLGVPYERS